MDLQCFNDNDVISIVFAFILAAIGLVGYSTGQLLWRQRLHQRHHPHHHPALFQYNTVEAGWVQCWGYRFTQCFTWHLLSSRDENTDKEPNTLWYRLEDVGMGRACSHVYIFKEFDVNSGTWSRARRR